MRNEMVDFPKFGHILSMPLQPVMLVFQEFGFSKSVKKQLYHHQMQIPMVRTFPGAKLHDIGWKKTVMRMQ